MKSAWPTADRLEFPAGIFNDILVIRFHFGDAADHKYPFCTQLVLGAGILLLGINQNADLSDFCCEFFLFTCQ